MKTETKQKTEVLSVERDIYQSVTTKDLQGLLTESSNKGANFVKLFTETTPKMRKTNNPYIDKVYKKSQLVCMVGFHYENVVNNARAKEAFQLAIDYFAEQFGISKKRAKKHLESLMPKATNKVKDFQANPRKWGKHINSILIDHTNKAGTYKVYVQVWVLHTQKPTYHYLDNLEQLDETELEELKTFIPKSNSNAKHQGLDKEVIIRDYDISNIDKIHINKQKFVVR